MLPLEKIVFVKTDPDSWPSKMKFEDYCLIYKNEDEIKNAGGTEKIEQLLTQERKIALGFMIGEIHDDMPDFANCDRLIGWYIGNYNDPDLVMNKIVAHYRAMFYQ
jgi:hypothetical protein